MENSTIFVFISSQHIHEDIANAEPKTLNADMISYYLEYQAKKSITSEKINVFY